MWRSCRPRIAPIFGVFRGVRMRAERHEQRSRRRRAGSPLLVAGSPLPRDAAKRARMAPHDCAFLAVEVGKNKVCGGPRGSNDLRLTTHPPVSGHLRKPTGETEEGEM